MHREIEAMVVLKNIDGEVIKEYPELNTLAGADLSYEDLDFVDFSGMDLTDTDFHGASLRWTHFDGAITDGANFTDTCYEKVVSYGGGGHHEHYRGY